MWNRAYLKSNAKQALQNTYWRSFLVTLIAAAFEIGNVGASFNVNMGEIGSRFGGMANADVGRHALEGFFANPVLALLAVLTFLMLCLLGLVFGCAVLFFLKNPLKAGMAGYFIKNRRGQGDVGTLFSVFTGGRYLQTVKTMAIVSLKVFLWSLLFMIPGIVKAYSYSMVPYILSQNPYMSSERAQFLSRQMTRGQKWRMFVLDLSFLGWLLLGALCLGIGTFFVIPYIEATRAELYEALKFKVLADNVAGYSEFVEDVPEA